MGSRARSRSLVSLIGRHWTSDVVAGAWLGHGIASGAVSGAPIWIWQW